MQGKEDLICLSTLKKLLSTSLKIPRLSLFPQKKKKIPGFCRSGIVSINFTGCQRKRSSLCRHPPVDHETSDHRQGRFDKLQVRISYRNATNLNEDFSQFTFSLEINHERTTQFLICFDIISRSVSIAPDNSTRFSLPYRTTRCAIILHGN